MPITASSKKARSHSCTVTPTSGTHSALPDGRAGLLDWQVVWQGPGLREVAYWMAGGLEPEVRRKHEHELLDRYLEGLRAGGVTDVLSAAAAFERYRLFAAEAWDAAAMTIAWPGLQAHREHKCWLATHMHRSGGPRHRRAS